MTSSARYITAEYVNNVRKLGLRPEVVCFFVNGGSLLLFHKSEYNLWMTPQGGIDCKESVEDAIVREVSEEVGAEFIKNFTGNPVFIGEGDVEFSEVLYGDRDLITDSGEKVLMKGKKYFYFAINVKNRELIIKNVEFDDYFWLDYIAVKFLFSKNKQANKRKLNLDMLEILKERKLIF